MISIILFLVLLMVTVFYFFNNFKEQEVQTGSYYDHGLRKDVPRYETRRILTQKALKNLIFLGISLILVPIFQPFAVERVDAGNVGIMVNLTGNERGVSKFEYKTGWVIVNTWTKKLYEYPTFLQHIDYPEQVVITKGGFQTRIKPTFNYSLLPGKIGDMFTNLRNPLSEIEQKWLNTAIVGSVNDVANVWTVDDIFNNREKFETEISNEVSKRTKRWFLISQLRTNIVPPDELKASILEKTKAIQEVQVAENNKKVIIAKAQTEIERAKGAATAKIETARGDSASLIINATAEARSMQLKQQQITKDFVEYIKWLNASPDIPRVPSTILGSGTSYLYNPK